VVGVGEEVRSWTLYMMGYPGVARIRFVCQEQEGSIADWSSTKRKRAVVVSVLDSLDYMRRNQRWLIDGLVIGRAACSGSLPDYTADESCVQDLGYTLTLGCKLSAGGMAVVVIGTVSLQNVEGCR